MPFKDPRQHLRDIARSIDYIEVFLGEMTAEQVRADRKTEAAVERELGILTEAATRLGDEAEILCPGPDWRNIRGLGNILRHAYDHIDIKSMWQVLKRDLPVLKGHVRSALGKLGE